MARAVWSCHSRVSDFADEHQYGDVLGEIYLYDSNVINHAQVTVDDVLVIRDAHLIYGYGIVDRIDSGAGIKEIRRCPQCRKSGFTTRKSVLPRHRCGSCHHEFDVPLIDPTAVTVYSAHYQSWWLEFPSPSPEPARCRARCRAPLYIR